MPNDSKIFDTSIFKKTAIKGIVKRHDPSQSGYFAFFYLIFLLTDVLVCCFFMQGVLICKSVFLFNFFSKENIRINIQITFT